MGRMRALARLSFWVPAQKLVDFEEDYEKLLVPLLRKHDIEEAAEPGRATAEGVFSRLFEMEQPDAVEVKARVLRRDPVWQAMRQELGRVFGNAEPDGRLRYSFDLYRAPAGPGRTVEVGPGYRQGLWQRFEFQDGLPVSALLHLRQDQQGDLWLASWEGIWRYDGEQATALTSADGLVDDGVICQLEDRQGRLWVGTEGGLSCLDGSQWTSYTTADGLGDNRVCALLEDQQGRLWIGTRGGLSCFDGPRLVNRTTADGLMDNRVEALLEDRQGRLWVGTEGGLSCRAGEGFVAGAGADGPMATGVHSLLEDRQGRLWVGTSEGVCWWDGKGFTALTAAEGLARGQVLSMLEDREGHLWFATYGGGVNRYEGSRFVTFTGAVARKLGKVELAEGGTLFLDEIGDLSLEAQAKLLQLLEEKTYTRVGGTQTRSVDARVIAATNRDLWGMVPAGTFRPDLYFRLHEFQVELPPLRQRREDIAELATYFAARMAAHLDKKIERFAPETLDLLQAYGWPGNVRELEHAVQRAVVVCPGEVIRREDLALGTTGQSSTEEILPLEEVERRHIQEVLEKTGWVIKGPKGAAALLGVPASTLRDHMEKLGIARR
ncbi:MAG: sigma 54-interacting transcriptional regulator [Candidatus Latescibacteria bacterium]|nr:sigma 54-interacting transcriptional regulator [Candidatus Latescibacterota bacterium]